MFAAILLPDETREALDRIVEPRRDEEWRWMLPESWHITLSFYEQVEPWRYDTLVQRLASAASRTPSFPLGLEGVGTFPTGSPEKAKLLYAAVDDPTDSLPGLNRRCHHAATTSGIEVSASRYVPHLTLARTSRPMVATRWLRALIGTYAEQWQVDEISLVASHLGQGRPRYEVCERFSLGELSSW